MVEIQVCPTPEVKPIPTIDDIDPETGQLYTKSKIKKIRKILDANKRKEEKAAHTLERKKIQKEEKERNLIEKSLNLQFEEIHEDPLLPQATRIEIRRVAENIGKRVKIFGWVDAIRSQGGLTFILLRDGTQLMHRLQCVLEGRLAKTKESSELVTECSVCVWGTLREEKRAEMGIELNADYWELIGGSTGEFKNTVDDDSNVTFAMDNRHLFLRKKTFSQIFSMRSTVVQCFREALFEEQFTEVTPPTLVETMVEGGSTLFTVDYFGKPVYLTQSSQLYLETCIYALGKVFSILPSFRAEKTRTRRHVTEYTHLESEMPFICFDDLLNHIEDLVVSVCELVLKKKNREVLEALNPEFKVPKKPFRRMDHSEAIEFCRANKIYKNEETKEDFELGDDIPEAPERKMTDLINEPVFLCRFPTEMKPFYMKKCEHDRELTESVDLLIPGVGEIVGGSMRESNYEELMKGFAEKGIDASKYYWYTDLRKYGTVEHGGYGLGVERFLCWMLRRDHIRDVCLYPRFTNRCSP